MGRPSDLTSLDFLMDVVEFASSARTDGWTVNLALETGGTDERITLSASRVRADLTSGGEDA